MNTNQPVPATPADGGGAPDGRQLRAILITVSTALMAVIASARSIL